MVPANAFADKAQSFKHLALNIKCNSDRDHAEFGRMGGVGGSKGPSNHGATIKENDASDTRNE